MPQTLLDLSIVVPVYNAEQQILKSLQKIKSYLDSLNLVYEVIVVDDGSTDNTRTVVSGFLTQFPEGQLLVSPKNAGKGHSVRRGMLAARGEYVLFSDADLSTPMDQLEKLLKAIYSGYDIAIGSRRISGAVVPVQQPWRFQMMDKIFNRCVRFLLLPGLVDTQCGFKCFRRDCVLPLFSRQKIDSFCFDVEILFLAKKMGFTMEEVPVLWSHDADSRVRLFRDSARMVWDLLRIRFFVLLGFYSFSRRFDD